MFEHLGYFKEYWIGQKYIGGLKSDKDRDVFGYYGTKEETVVDRIILENKKFIKPGTIVKTILYPLCGRTI